MTDTVRADFRADVTLSTRTVSEFELMRVLVSDDQLVLMTDETKETVPLNDIFDIAQDVPASAPPDVKTTVTIGFNRGESRETATIKAEADTLAKFQFVVFKLVLNETSVIVRQVGHTSEDTYKQGTVSLQSKSVHFDFDGDALTLSREDIKGFSTGTADAGGQTDRPTLAIHTNRNGVPLKVKVGVPSFRLMNIFGRFLQSSPDAGIESSSVQEPETFDVLVVDDDPGDLDTVDLMLTKLDDRITTTTATSAPGGLDAIKDAPFDCVVSDYDMPGTNGIEFLQQVRESYPTLPFILFTGQGSEEVAKQAILSDVTDYVEKGIGTEQYDILVKRIRKACR